MRATGNVIGDQGVEGLAPVPFTLGLVRLTLRRNEIGDSGAGDLALLPATV